MALTAAVVLAASGCASVPMAPKERDDGAKTFATRSGMANLYIYRSSSLGTAVKFPVVLDGKMMGELPGKTFILAPVAPGPHTVYVSAENSESVAVDAQPGTNHYVRVSPAIGWLSARVGVAIVSDEKEARNEVVECSLIQGMP
ncbi:DUF2846 domain-containing protein [Anaeromyxobacter diazotrophicus]|nr:DUF2846 domain-containing protein [Anaeromyxobacter diazotrophicus]